MGNLFYSFFVLSIATFFLILGVIGLSLPWSSTLQATFANLLTTNWILFSLINLLFVLIGTSVTALIFSGERRKTIHIRMGKKGISIHRDAVHHYLHSYWKKIFPKEEVPFRFVYKAHSIHIHADLPLVSETEQETITERIQRDLDEIFYRTMGYANDIHLSLTFPEKGEDAPSSTPSPAEIA